MSTNPVTAGLAQLTGQDEVDVAMLLGGAWTPSQLLFDPRSEPVSELQDVFVLGEPVQLVAVRLFEGLKWTIGAARIEWATQTPVLTMTGEVPIVAGDDLVTKAEAIRQLLAARRRSFRYCSVCACQVAPEHRSDANVCQGCASEWLHVVY